jgi:cytochrome c
MNDRLSRFALALYALVAASFVGCAPDKPPPANGANREASAASSAVTAADPAASTPNAESVADQGAQKETSAAGTLDVGAALSAAESLDDPDLAGADLERGKLLSLACAACHTFGAGERTIVGPNLHGVFGRRAASLPDFGYSPALRASGLTWTPRSLAAWLADPQGFVSGTTMTFTGYHSPEDRRDLIAFLLRATE